MKRCMTPLYFCYKQIHAYERVRIRTKSCTSLINKHMYKNEVLYNTSSFINMHEVKSSTTLLHFTNTHMYKAKSNTTHLSLSTYTHMVETTCTCDASVFINAHAHMSLSMYTCTRTNPCTTPLLKSIRGNFFLTFSLLKTNFCYLRSFFAA